MSRSPDPSLQIPRSPRLALDRATRLAEEAGSPAEFFEEFLNFARAILVAPAVAVWMRTPQGDIKPSAQAGVEGIAATLGAEWRERHDAFLRQAIDCGHPVSFSSHAGKANLNQAGVPAYTLLFAPIREREQAIGLLEVWLPVELERPADQGAMRQVVELAAVVARFLDKQQARQTIDRQTLWDHIEAFDCAVHASLHPTEVAFVVANESRRLLGVDRVSVALRPGRRVRVEAVSGTDLVERRANIVRRLRDLCERVLERGERLVFSGVPDESLPPDLVERLDAYLAEAAPKLLIIEPLLDPRDKVLKTPPRSVVVVETFHAVGNLDVLQARLDVVGRHSVGALYNALEHHQIPFQLLWRPLLRLQKGLGGKARAITIAASVAIALLLAALIWVPYPLKMDATGQLLPKERCWVYAPVEGQVIEFAPGIVPGATVVEGQSLVLMNDVQLQLKVVQLQGEIAAAQHDVEALTAQHNAAANETERQSIAGERKKKEFLRERKSKELQALRERTNAIEGRPGYFWLKSPMAGTVLNSDFRENLRHRQVKPSDPLLRIGDKSGPWEIELKIPHKHLGQVLLAFDPQRPQTELEIDLLLTGHPTRAYRGKLIAAQVGGEATANKDDASDTEPVLLAWVRIEGDGIGSADTIPPELLLSGAEVHAKIRCGDRRLGYALFYGVWEFAYEKLVFWF